MKKRSASFSKKTKITAQITTIPATITAALLMIIIMLTGTITAVWATTEAVPTENGTSIDEPSPTEPLRNEAQTGAAGDGSSNTQGDEGLAEEAQVGTAEEPSSSKQSESTTIAEEDESSNEGPMFEGPSVPLNQTGIVEPLENVTSTTTSNATATNTTNSTTTRSNGKIAFLKGVNGESEFDEIFVMSADGGEQTLLISNDEYVQTRHPTWSPDGQKIAFSSLREDIDDSEGIFVMNVADGDSNVTRLTDGVQPSWSPDGEKIAFVGDGGIYVMNADDDGSDVTRLTDDPESDSFPTWSPDGEKIAFQRGGEFENSSEIYVMNAEDGSGVTRLTNNNMPDFQPSWSPDGERIAFVSLRDNPGGESEIYVMNADDDGSGVTRLTDDPESDSFPTWSPDGEKIAFVSLRDTETEREHNAIFLMNAEDGSNVTGLTDTDAWYSELNWGGTTMSTPTDDDDGPTTNATTSRPNGKIAFVKGPVDEHEFDEIYVMNAAEGSEQIQLTNNTDTSDSDPSWSPDGTKIAFSSNRDSGNWDIYVMNADDDGSDVTRLTNDPADDGSPTWSPDGTKIAFSSERDKTEENSENSQIYVMNSDDGSGVTRLTNNNASDSDPSWSPDGEKIAFVSDRDVNFEIYSMNADDGSEQTNLSNNSADDGSPTWSPDGTKIAFDSNREDESNFEIYIMNAADDGSGVTRLTNDPAFDTDPTWSPDGTKIAFASSRDVLEDEGPDIYVMNSDDGSNIIRLTNTDANDFSPDWGTTTSPPADSGNNSSNAQTPPQQAIEKAIAAIQNLDGIPQNVKTKLIALLRQGIDFLNNGTTILPPPLRTNMP